MWLSDMWVPELLLPPKIIGSLAQKRLFLPKNLLSWAHIGLAGSFGAQYVGWLIVVVCGLYLARHLSTL